MSDERQGPMLTINLHNEIMLAYDGMIYEIPVSAAEYRQFAAACMAAAERIELRERQATAGGLA